MAGKKALVVFYSRSGTTRRLAKTLSQLMRCEIEEIVETGSRSGVIGYIRSLFEAVHKRSPQIVPPTKDPSSYDLVVIGTPVWGASVSSPVRSYLAAHRGRLPEVAFFCTLGGRGSGRAFAQMEALVGKAPRAHCAVMASEMASGKPGTKVLDFIRLLSV